MMPSRLDVTEGWNFLMRVYRPGPSVLDGSYQLPNATEITLSYAPSERRAIPGIVYLIHNGMGYCNNASATYCEMRDCKTPRRIRGQTSSFKVLTISCNLPILLRFLGDSA